MRERKASKPGKWRGKLLLSVAMLFLMTGVALLEFLVLSPQRLERQRQARRDAPPKIAPQGQGSLMEEGGGGELITAFRVEDWRLPEPDPGRAAATDSYLNGYLLSRAAEADVQAGDTEAAREKLREAAEMLETLSRSDPPFEREMVEFRRNKILEALAEIDPAAAGPAASGGDAPSGDPE